MKTCYIADGLIFGLALAVLSVTAVRADSQDQSTVRAWLRVRAVPPRIGAAADGKLDLQEFEFYRRNLAAIVRSPLVINKALEDKQVKDLPLVKERANDVDGLMEWLVDRLRVRFPGDAEIMTIEMRTTDRRQAVVIVNAIAAALISEFIDGKEKKDQVSRFDALEKRLNTYKDQVLEKERQLFNLRQQLGTGDPQTAKVQYKMQIDALDTLMRSRTDIQRKISDLDFKIALAKAMNDLGEKNKIPDEDVEALISKDPAIQQMSVELAQLVREKSAIEKIITKKTDPNFVAIQEQIAQVKQGIDEAKSARQQIADQLHRTGAAPGTNVQAQLVERQLLEVQLKQVTEKIEAQAKAIQDLEKFNGDADQLRDEINQLKAVVNEIGIGVAKSKIELDAERRVSIIQEAR